MAAEAFVVARTNRIIAKSITVYFELYYGLHATADSEDLCAALPDTAFGGTKARCQAYSPEGVVASFEEAVAWDWVWVEGDYLSNDAMTPNEVLLATLLDQPYPFTADRVTFRDSQLFRDADPPRDSFRSRPLWFDTDSVLTNQIPWSASVCVEPQAVYEDSTGTVVGTILLSEVGGDPYCITENFPRLIALPNERSSWGHIKSLYER
jgi:hypothetical protein